MDWEVRLNLEKAVNQHVYNDLDEKITSYAFP